MWADTDIRAPNIDRKLGIVPMGDLEGMTAGRAVSLPYGFYFWKIEISPGLGKRGTFSGGG